MFICTYKKSLISSDGYANAGVLFKRVQNTGKSWASMCDAGSSMGIKNIFDLVLKEIHGILKTKIPQRAN